MIQSKELRIGNFLSHRIGFKEEVVRVNSINDSGINLRAGDGVCIYADEEFEHLHGIPLAEEWLVKFGFNKDKMIRLPNQYKNLYIPFDKDFEARISMPLGNGIMTIAKGLKHVHQLQNLYFALTGEELKIKN